MIVDVKRANKTKTHSTWMQGVLAFRSGIGLGGNPYETHDCNNHETMLDRDGWVNGWYYARDNHNQRAELARLNAEHAALRAEIARLQAPNVRANRPSGAAQE